MKKSKWISILMITILLIGLLPAAQASASEKILKETPLVAGQSTIVGKVTVTDLGMGKLSVTYSLSKGALNDGWLIYETNLAVGSQLSAIPQNKNHNPIPGKFQYRKSFQTGTSQYTEYVGLSGLGYYSDLYVAAHAVIRKHNRVVSASAPYSGSRVLSYDQGVRFDGTSVIASRSNPTQGLYFETGASDSSFFSLGFAGPNNDGWYIVEFDKPILNGAGNDIQVVEDTWGLPYPVEKAEVLVSQDGTNWHSLGVADNQRPISNLHTITEFDLSQAGINSARFVKLRDCSVREDFAYLYSTQGATLDGYDLNAVLSLQDYVEESVDEETAWGSGTRFNCKGDWGMYFIVHKTCGTGCGQIKLIYSCDFIKDILNRDCLKIFDIFDCINYKYTCGKFDFDDLFRF